MDALLKIKQNHRVAPIPLNQLINLTYNTDICCFAPRVSNHEELGAFLYANEMLSNEAMALLDTTEEGSGFQERLLELLGEQHQEDHGGVFTDFGYAELGGEIKDIYVCQSNETACFHRSDAPVVLEVRKGFFNDPSYDNDKTAVLNLPAADAGIWRAVEKVDAASVDECAFRCVDCLIPFLRDAINNAIDDEDGIEQADEFAKRLAQIEREWPESDMVKYKALLSVVDHPSLQDATRLMGEIDQYELRPEVAQTWGYAEMMFREKYSALPEELFQTPQAAQIGQKMLDDRLGVITEYGLIRRKDGQASPGISAGTGNRTRTGDDVSDVKIKTPPSLTSWTASMLQNRSMTGWSGAFPIDRERKDPVPRGDGVGEAPRDRPCDADCVPTGLLRPLLWRGRRGRAWKICHGEHRVFLGCRPSIPECGAFGGRLPPVAEWSLL